MNSHSRARISALESMMRAAEVFAERSHCSRLQVGCVITDMRLRNILAIGYNGNYSGGPNNCDSPTPGACGCLHAEVNALSKARQSSPCTLFTTHAPCLACAKLIAGADVRALYYRYEYRNSEGLALLRSLGIPCEQLESESKPLPRVFDAGARDRNLLKTA